MEDGNKESFIEKEAQKIREKGKAAYFRRGMFRCPYCTTKPKPRDGIYEIGRASCRERVYVLV